MVSTDRCWWRRRTWAGLLGWLWITWMEIGSTGVTPKKTSLSPWSLMAQTGRSSYQEVRRLRCRTANLQKYKHKWSFVWVALIYQVFHSKYAFKYCVFSVLDIGHPYSLDVFEGHVYWTTKEKGEVWRTNKFGNGNKVKVLTINPWLTQVRIYQEHRHNQTGQNTEGFISWWFRIREILYSCVSCFRQIIVVNILLLLQTKKYRIGQSIVISIYVLNVIVLAKE